MTSDDARIAQIRARLEAATPGPWGYNSYSGVFGPPELCAADDGPDYPESPRPTPGSPEDRVWVAQRSAAYEADPRVCKVPALYGDTAIGRHAADAEFIAHAREDVPYLLARLDALAAEAARLVDELTTLLYEVVKRWQLQDGRVCEIVACGACRKKADKPESVVHESDCPVYRLTRAEAANTAVIRANAEEIADLEDVRDELEATFNGVVAEIEHERKMFASLTDASVRRIDALTTERDELRSLLRDRSPLFQDYEDMKAERDALRGWQDGQTHYVGCWREHRRCALTTIDFEAARRERAELALREAVAELNRLREGQDDERR